MKHTIQEENWRKRFDEKYHYQNGVELLLNSPNHSQVYDVTFGIKKFIADELASQLQSILEDLKSISDREVDGSYLPDGVFAYYQSDLESIISNRMGEK